MKHFLLPLATITFLLFLLSPTTCTTTDGDTNVLDVLGEPLIAREKYYIAPYSIDEGGGFKWSLKKEFSLCPHFYVTQAEENLSSGNYTSFSPINSKQNIISLSSDLNIEFPDFSPPWPFYCWPRSKTWRIEADPSTGDLLVAIAGNEKDVTSWFKIEEHEVNGYKIRYCPSSSNNNGVYMGDVVCGDLGVVYAGGGERWLGVNSTHPLAVMFAKDAYVKKV